ncbi:Alpha/Beta hydrolase protein [Lasiosphaeria miniovina]|uniref:Alpha/Beta hydrolase protein n=1 Tax=Lasiosphaeria miniovina TaxID=1954250 RepID=A0AA40AUW2_9PEZI|nr:Alpha/Beta hydrolase protein [Lasiosphaeria miniovina]KAK0722455.1 Alpha/Beta hydrolase protein [Lasiosphaeria miniovina]
MAGEAAAAPGKLTPDDSHTLLVRGKTYHYLLGNPAGGVSSTTTTVVLVHGWPDLAFGWRYQVPFLQALGLRVVVPDMLGYGRTDAPEPIEPYSYKSVVEDLAVLAAHVAGPRQPVVLGGHDWGGAVVWRFALWRPELTCAVFSVCTPYWQPLKTWVPREVLVETLLPNFRYQLQLAGPDVEADVVGPEKLRRFLSSLFGGRGPNDEFGFSTEVGVMFENLDKIGPSPLLSAAEMDFYVDEYSRHGLHGPLNWYRNSRVNFEEEQELVEQNRSRISAPSLLIVASKDKALPPAMAAGMDRFFDSLVKEEVNTNHWALWEAPQEVNGHIGKFLADVLKADKGPKASI